MAILKYCLEDNKYFQEVKNNSSSTYLSLLNRFKLLELKKDKIVVKKKSNNDKYFIVLRGVIEVIDYQQVKGKKNEQKNQKQFRSVVLKTY